MNNNVKPNRAFNLALIAGVLILINAVLLGAAATWFPWIIPTLPGPTGNSNIPFGSLTAIGLVSGIMVIVGAILIRVEALNRKICGILVTAFSIPSVIMGGGFIIGFVLGIIGGVTAFRGAR